MLKFGAYESLRCLATVCLMTSFLFLGGCSTTGMRRLSLQKYEQSPTEYDGRRLSIELKLGAEIRQMSEGMLPPEAQQLSLPDMAHDGNLMVVENTTGGRTLVACSTTWGVEGGGFYSTPGNYNPQTGVYSPGFTVSTPGELTRQHQESRAVAVDRLMNFDDYLLAHVGVPPDLDTSYFGRNPNYERLLSEDNWLVHPGYSVLGSDFWVLVPKALVSGLRLLSEPMSVDVSLAEPKPSTRRHHREYVSDAWWPCDQFREQMISAARAVAEDNENADFATVAHVYSLSYAADNALCLASQHQDGEAIAHLEQVISEITNERVWSHGSLYEVYAALLLIRICQGEIEEAVAAAGLLFHMSRPDWTLPDNPSFVINARSSAWSTFFEARIDDLAEHWSLLVAAIDERLAP